MRWSSVAACSSEASKRAGLIEIIYCGEEGGGGRLCGTGRDCCLRQPDTVDVFWGSYWTASRRRCSSRVARSLKCHSPPLLRVGQEYFLHCRSCSGVGWQVVGKRGRRFVERTRTTSKNNGLLTGRLSSPQPPPPLSFCFPAPPPPPPPLPGTIQANSCSNSAWVCGAAWRVFLTTVTLQRPPGEDMSTHRTGDRTCSVGVGSEAPCCLRNNGPLYQMSELESCVKVEVAVRNSPYCLSGRKDTFRLVWKFLCFMYKFSLIHSGFI